MKGAGRKREEEEEELGVLEGAGRKRKEGEIMEMEERGERRSLKGAGREEDRDMG